jgi:hypothetical protein
MAADLVKRDRPMPTKLSEWLRVAVEDTRRIPAECSTEELRFRPDMHEFNIENDGVCSACLAGFALMGVGLWKVGESPTSSNGLDVAWAIDALRTGNVKSALWYSQRSDAVVLPERVKRAEARVESERFSGEIDGCASDEAYLELADALAEMGL